jgi:cytochrome c nitrite reductase small subunit
LERQPPRKSYLPLFPLSEWRLNGFLSLRLGQADLGLLAPASVGEYEYRGVSWLNKWTIIGGILLGVFVGIGVYTFRYAEGFSYLGTNPKTCDNCHIMNDQYDSWRKGPHHAVAGCADCHLPHAIIPKYLAKMSNGYHHSKGFTFQDFHEPIMIKPHNARILQDNCLHCHADFVHAIVQGSKTEADAVRCVHCHQGVGHGPRT